MVTVYSLTRLSHSRAGAWGLPWLQSIALPVCHIAGPGSYHGYSL